MAAVAAAAVVVVRLDARVRTYLGGPALGRMRVYAGATTLAAGTVADPASLRRRLTRIGYVEVPRTPAAGEFRVSGRGIELRRRDAVAPRHVAVRLSRGRVADLRDLASDAAVVSLTLDSELLAVDGRGGAALEAGGEHVPDACRAAVLAAEDRHFFRHPGLDPIAIARALLANARAGEPVQGGSTITQQLVKNAFLTPERTLGRKLREAVLAMLVERRASKAEILERYVGSVYLGSDGGVPVHGLGHGALVYLGRPVAGLGPAECALLAGMIRAPNALAPDRHPDAARARRDEVLALMVDAGTLSPADAAAARATPLPARIRTRRPVGALYVVDEVRRQLARTLPGDVLRSPGLVVRTGIDAEAQRAAEAAVLRQLDAVDPGRRRKLEGALIAIDAATGRIRALVGGRDYRSSPLDRAVRARRQPGSAFKPFVFLAAVDPSRTAGPRTVLSTVRDMPVTVDVADGAWRPVNHRGDYRGTVSLEDAMAHSLNAATVRLALDVGVEAAVQAARDLGIAAPLPAVPALALGAAEVSLLELTSAYAGLAAGGVVRPPVLVESVTAADGQVLYEAPAGSHRAVDPAVAYLMTHLLEGVVDRGTGRAARAAGLRGPAAGKTGTSDGGRDAWFVGWTPDIVAGVWVGRDRGAGTGITGTGAALPVWTAFVRAMGAGTGGDAFPVPPGIVWREVDPATGLLATEHCPAPRRTPFLTGTEPTGACEEHRPVWAAVGGGVEEAARGVGRAVESAGRTVGRWLGDLFR